MIKSNETIIKALRCQDERKTHCNDCPYYEDIDGIYMVCCADNLDNDAADLIEKLIAERDAAIADLKNTFDCCQYCKHNVSTITCPRSKADGSCFEWRGVKGVRYE